MIEHKDLHHKSKWSSVKKRIDDDDRYRNKHLDSSFREQIFRDYVFALPAETSVFKIFLMLIKTHLINLE